MARSKIWDLFKDNDGCVIFKLTAKPLGNENFHTGGFWDYSEILKTVGIIPILAPAESYEKGEWKEQVSMISANSVASIYIRMDLEKYLSADDTEKKNLYKEMIISAIKKVRAKGKFSFDQFCKDIEDFTNSSMD